MSYTLTPTQQLIDLNGELKNFVASFSVEALDGKSPFQAAVVTQQQLGEDHFEYSRFLGKAEGDVENSSSLIQKYFLALKADTSIPVTVTIRRNEIPQGNPSAPAPPTPPAQDLPPELQPKVNFKVLGAIGLVLLLGVILYRTRKGPKGSSNESQF